MQNEDKVFYTRRVTSGYSEKNLEVGTEILQRDFWNLMSGHVKCGGQLHILPLPTGSVNGGLSFLVIWGSWRANEVLSKPLRGVHYQRLLTEL